MDESSTLEGKGDDGPVPRPAQAGVVGLVTVLAAVILRDGRYLVGRRPAHKRHGGLWEFPGGKLLADESWEEGARRELAEEFRGLNVIDVGAAPVLELRDADSAFLICFVTVEASGEPEALEHEELRWASKRDLLALELAPADRQFAEWLID